MTERPEDQETMRRDAEYRMWQRASEAPSVYSDEPTERPEERRVSVFRDAFVTLMAWLLGYRARTVKTGPHPGATRSHEEVRRAVRRERPEERDSLAEKMDANERYRALEAEVKELREENASQQAELRDLYRIRLSPPYTPTGNEDRRKSEAYQEAADDYEGSAEQAFDQAEDHRQAREEGN